MTTQILKAKNEAVKSYQKMTSVYKKYIHASLSQAYHDANIPTDGTVELVLTGLVETFELVSFNEQVKLNLNYALSQGKGFTETFHLYGKLIGKNGRKSSKVSKVHGVFTFTTGLGFVQFYNKAFMKITLK